MLDTNILSYLMKKNHPQHRILMEKLMKEAAGSVAISVITLSEISKGIENLSDELFKKKLLQAVEHILSSLTILEFDDEAAWLYGKIKNNLSKMGQDIGAIDTLIAAHALSQKLVLVTHNSKHFQRVDGLQLEQWL